MPTDAENEESVVGPVASTNSNSPLFPADSPITNEVLLTSKPHAFREDDDTDGMTGDTDKFPTVGPSNDSSSRSGYIVEGGKTTGMTAKDLEVGNCQRKFPAETPLINDRFINFDETKLGGYDSEGELMPYNALALNEDADEYDEKIVGGDGGIPIPTVAMPTNT